MANVWISWIANFDDTDTVDGELRTKKAVKRFKLGILWEAWQFNLCKGIVNCDQLKLPASFHLLHQGGQMESGQSRINRGKRLQPTEGVGSIITDFNLVYI